MDRRGGRLRRMVPRLAVTASLGLVVFGGEVQSAAALTITPYFDSSVIGAANASQIEAAVDAAIHPLASMFGDPVNVGILFGVAHGGNTFLGESLNAGYLFPYSDYTSALAFDAATHVNHPESAGVASLGTATRADLIFATSADSRAVGCGGCLGEFDSHGNYTGSGPMDGVVLLNIDAPLAFARSHGTIGATQYDARSVLQHEIDEVLGIGGAGSALNDAYAQGVNGPPSISIGGSTQTYISPLDLYRYAGPGAASFTTDPAATAYFSLDGGRTAIARFSQDPNGDAGDWYSPGPLEPFAPCGSLVQDAFACPGIVANMGPNSPEVTALQAIGYDRVPEPGTLPLLST
ncbi:MAG: NF038122 family metalloprotease, partial [Gemmataceae bacterium]